MTQLIDIILPVYRDLEATGRAIRSVLDSQNQQAWHLIVINDASPDAQMPALLESLCAGNPHISLLTNEENLGFVRTVNRGFAVHPERDIVILNSDTVVSHNWLDRIIGHASDSVASITPFSNNATICSTPRIDAVNPDLADPVHDAAAIDAMHAGVNAGQSILIPTGVGFCMWMARKAMQAAGYFDEKAFGKGYGEEVDWCMRTARMGYLHLLACDVFVYHEGGVSFSEQSNALKENAQKIINKRYPNYESLVRNWVHKDEALPFRIAITAEYYRSTGLPIIVHISHFLGGGTEKHIRELSAFASGAKHLLLHPDPSGGLRLKSLNAADGVDLIFSLRESMIPLQNLLIGFGISRFHLHSVIGFDDTQLKQLILSMGIAFDVTIHDYYFICPQIFLIDQSGRYCKEPDEAECNRCISQRPRYNAKEISSWRSNHSWWFDHAARVIVPSIDVAVRLRRYHPQANFIVMPHPEALLPKATALPELTDNEPLRIAVIGALCLHKGVMQLIDLMKAASKAGIRASLIHFGNIGDRTPPGRCGSVTFASHGLYIEGELQQLLAEANPHLIWFPTNCPETYSYTLTQALASGVPIWTPQLGAFMERTANQEWMFSYAVDAESQAMAEQLASIREQIASSAAPNPLVNPYSPSPVPLQDYAAHYVTQHLDDGPAFSKTLPSRQAYRIIGWITDPDDPANSSGSLRISQPLTHPAISNQIKLLPLSLHRAFEAKVDALLLSRTTLCSPYLIDRLLQHCRSRSIPLIYDLDDDLITISESHSEYYKYRWLTEGIKLLVQHADCVTVTTPSLAHVAIAHRKTALPPPLIIPNYCDERIEMPPTSEAIASRQSAHSLRVLYIGSPATQGDFDHIASAIRPILRNHRASLSVFGMEHPPRWAINLEPPSGTALSMADTARWLTKLQQEQPWHIGLAPLLNTPFNCSKSGNQFLRYSMLGLAGLYADLPPYQNIVNHNENGLLVSPTSPQDWAAALDKLLSDAATRTRLAQIAAQTLRKRHTLEGDAAFWAPVWINALSTPSTCQRSIKLPPLYQTITALLESSPKRYDLKRLAKGLIHRCASHAILRACWRNSPLIFKKRIRQIIHQRLTT